MRFLHTSDWHLGRSFHREDLLGAQAAFVDHLVDTVRSERVDAVLVSGDVYDRALPPVDAVELANDTLHRLVSTGVRVVISSGNHDSAQRLGFAADLIDTAGVHLRTDPSRIGTPVVFEDARGNAGGVAVYALPYLEPDLVRTSLDVSERSHQAVLSAAMHRVRANAADHPGRRCVVMAHAFVTGATASQSERDIAVGGVSSVGRDTFAGVDYAALGHLHGRHTLSETVRYSGSPLAYSFSEASHRKGSWLVEMGAHGLESVTFVDAPVPRPLALIRGRFDELLVDRRYDTAEHAWVQVTLTDALRPRDAMEQLRSRFPHCVAILFEPDGQQASMPPDGFDPRHLADRRDEEIVADFVRDVRGREPSTDEAALIRAACEGCRLAEDLAS
ncbi:MAG TPA: exonuclease SbcCD subunit D [Nocardioidaceae bacterium]